MLIRRHCHHYQRSGMYDKIKAFALYFERTWINGSYPVSLWTHFDNCGPRTMNFAEGFLMPNPSMRNFMNWLQKFQNEIQFRQMQFNAGRSVKPRPALFFPMAASDRSGDTPLTADNVCVKITNLLRIHYNDSILMFN